MRLANRVAIVTGGGMGIGAGISTRLAEEGATIAIFDVNREAGDTTASDIEAAGGTARCYRVDVRDRDQVESAVEGVVQDFGAVDILVNNAGVSIPSKLARLTDEAWDTVNDVNLKGVFCCCRAVIPHMKDRKYGRIVNIASVLAAAGSSYYVHYSATKAGAVGLTRGLAVELGPHNITVNAVGPGVIDTPMSHSDVAPEVRERLEKRIAMRRIGEPGDIANAVLFLAGDESCYITGQCLFVCGGLSADAGLV